SNMIRFLLYLPGDLLSAHVPIILVNKTLNWSSAQDFCRQYYTDLAAIESLEADDVLGDLSNTSAWVGLYWDCAENWQWSDGQKINYTAWDEMVCCSLRLPTTAKCTDQRFNFCRGNLQLNCI
uniref:C-type lectin domain-containing protein n=1 Tax=Denticeps clupeoides TaxID=299321 RepID=A0AAY4BKE8_9TELE